MPPSSDLEATTLFNQAESTEVLYFAGPAGKIAFEKFAKKFMGLTADESVVSSALHSVEAFFDVAERLLHDREYMAATILVLLTFTIYR